MADLEDIWMNAIETELDIQKQDLGRFKVRIYSLFEYPNGPLRFDDSSIYNS